MTDSIQILNIERVEKNNLLATCDVLITPWRMTLHSVTIFQKGTQRWIGMPSRKWEKDGEEKYQELVSFTDEGMKKRFRAQIMAAVDKFLLGNPNMEPEPAVRDDEEIPF
jgi:hypothetical protein